MKTSVSSSQNKKNVALVLSSGGARGMAQIGAIEVLEERGYQITSIAGCSIGSIIGGAYACGALPEFKEWVCGVEKVDILKMMDFIVSTKGLIKGAKVLQRMQEIFPDRPIEELPLPLTIISTDITNHKEIVHHTGSLYDAIRASISVPSVMSPVQKDDIEIVDGGIINPIPIDRVQRSEEDMVVAVDLNHPGEYHKPTKTQLQQQEENQKQNKLQEFINETWSELFPQKDVKEKKSKSLSYFELITSSLWVLQEKVTALYIEKYQPEVLINISRYSSDIFTFYKAKELIAYGRRETEKALDEYERKQ